MTYKLTNSMDGISRLELPLGTTRVSRTELAAMVASTLDSDLDWDERHNEKFLKRFVKNHVTSKTKAVKLARKAVHDYGVVTPSYRVGDGHVSEELFIEVENRITELWRG